MNLFKNKSKIKIRKEVQDDYLRMVIDYHMTDHPEEFKIGLIADVLGHKQCLAVIDTKLAYQRDDITRLTEELFLLLKEQGIVYKKITSKSDYVTRYMGIQIRSDSKKLINHVIGMIVASEDIEKLLSGNRWNICFYIDSTQASSEELLTLFELAQGDAEALSEHFTQQLYLDEFLSSFRLSCRKDNADVAERLIERYISTK